MLIKGVIEGRPWAHWNGNWHPFNPSTTVTHSSFVNKSPNIMAPERNLSQTATTQVFTATRHRTENIMNCFGASHRSKWIWGCIFLVGPDGLFDWVQMAQDQIFDRRWLRHASLLKYQRHVRHLDGGRVFTFAHLRHPSNSPAWKLKWMFLNESKFSPCHLKWVRGRYGARNGWREEVVWWLGNSILHHLRKFNLEFF